MLIARVSAAVLVLAGIAGCDAPKSPVQKADPDFATIHGVAWTNSAQDLAGVAATSKDKKATMYGFGDSILGGPTSVVSGNLVMSGVWTDRAVTIAGQDAKTGAIRWRLHLPTKRDGFAECNDDDHGPVFVCKVSVGPKQASTLWVVADRTGAVRTKIPVDPGTAYGVSGDELYLATFKPAKKDTRLDVVVKRRSLMGSRVAWIRKTSFAIEGWGHDGPQAFDIGRDRVVAYSGSWQVIVDRRTGRLLERSDQGRWEYELTNGGRVVLDSGDATSANVDVTLFSPDGRPLADLREETYPDPEEVEHQRLIIGRHLVSVGTGRAVFTAPKGQAIVAVVDGGRVAVAEPVDFESESGRVPLTSYDIASGKKLGVLSLKGEWTNQTVAGGKGIIKVLQHYDNKADKTLPPTVQVVDARRAKVLATIRLGRKPGNYDYPTLVRTPNGVAVTGAGGVRGLVAR